MVVVVEGSVECGAHNGVRFVDGEIEDVRSVCDSCGREERKPFVSASKRRVKDGPVCEVHRCKLMKDMFGLFCVYCVVEDTLDKK